MSVATIMPPTTLYHLPPPTGNQGQKADHKRLPDQLQLQVRLLW